MSFARRLRVAVRKMLYFHKRVSKLGPAYYNCNERQSACSRMKAKPRMGCPDCEYTVQHRMYLQELEAELRRLPNTTRQGGRRWPTKRLIEIASEVAHQAASHKTTNPKWSVATSAFVSLYRNEVAMMRSIDMHQMSATSNTGSEAPDEGDFN